MSKSEYARRLALLETTLLFAASLVTSADSVVSVPNLIWLPAVVDPVAGLLTWVSEVGSSFT